MTGKFDPSDETPGPKHVSKYPPYTRGSGPNPNFHDYGKGTLKKLIPKDQYDRTKDGPEIQGKEKT